MKFGQSCAPMRVARRGDLLKAREAALAASARWSLHSGRWRDEKQGNASTRVPAGHESACRSVVAAVGGLDTIRTNNARGPITGREPCLEGTPRSELAAAERCLGCNARVEVRPTNVFDTSATGIPVIAWQEDCQTCFMCERYCKSDALYVAPDCDVADDGDASAIVASGLLGQVRRDPGWDEWRRGLSPTSIGGWMVCFVGQGELASVSVSPPLTRSDVIVLNGREQPPCLALSCGKNILRVA